MCPENKCHLIVARLILKLHPQMAFPKAMVSADTFFPPPLPMRGDTDSIQGVWSELKLKRSRSTQGNWEVTTVDIRDKGKGLTERFCYFCAFQF